MAVRKLDVLYHFSALEGHSVTKNELVSMAIEQFFETKARSYLDNGGNQAMVSLLAGLLDDDNKPSQTPKENKTMETTPKNNPTVGINECECQPHPGVE
ncbi:MAG: hypothetical protein E7Z63_06105 [Thermoplasmata archaeon]|nr:hypothetical protein [Thermoplasmata archaeon]